MFVALELKPDPNATRHSDWMPLFTQFSSPLKNVKSTLYRDCMLFLIAKVYGKVLRQNAPVGEIFATILFVLILQS